jgi:hypothetical protein
VKINVATIDEQHTLFETANIEPRTVDLSAPINGSEFLNAQCFSMPSNLGLTLNVEYKQQQGHVQMLFTGLQKYRSFIGDDGMLLKTDRISTDPGEKIRP